MSCIMQLLAWASVGCCCTCTLQSCDGCNDEPSSAGVVLSVWFCSDHCNTVAIAVRNSVLLLNDQHCHYKA
jgi:hypothetical protein